MSKESIWLSGTPFELPEDSEIIIVRCPSNVDASELNNVKISTLLADSSEITKQLSFITTVGDGNSFGQFFPSRSYSFLRKRNPLELEDKTNYHPIVRTEKAPLIPPKSGIVSALPFAGPKPRQVKVAEEVAPSSRKKMKKSRS